MRRVLFSQSSLSYGTKNRGDFTVGLGGEWISKGYSYPVVRFTLSDA